jgi:hypothetical protein
MVDPPRSDGTGDEPDTRYDRESTTGIPRWVKVVGIVAAIVALLVVVMVLVGGGGHSPLRHAGDGANTPTVKVTGGGQAPTAVRQG